MAQARRPQAAIVVTGSELVRGDRQDLNGPFLAGQVLSLGIEPARITIVGDGEDALATALRDGLTADLCITSGGLGPTHDDRTVEVLGHVTGRPLVVDPALEAEIESVSRLIAERLRRPYADFETGVRKQASLPDGRARSGSREPRRGSCSSTTGASSSSCPDRRASCAASGQARWRASRCGRSARRTTPPGRRVLRFFGASESAVARALAEAGGDGDGVEATICARDFEIHVDLIVEPGADDRAEELGDRLASSLDRYLFSRDERPVEELVLDLCRARGVTLVTAESCTGGMVATRLTDVPGSSEVFVGAIVAYADEVKRDELGVPAEVLERHGAVSAEAAAAMAAGARERLRAAVAVAVTGVAGPGGGTPEKPVGLVYFHAAGPDGERAAEFSLRGDRDAIRRRSTVTALHLVRRLLTQADTNAYAFRPLASRVVIGFASSSAFGCRTRSSTASWHGEPRTSRGGSSRRDNLHVTLAFLGATPRDELPGIVAATEPIAPHGPYRFSAPPLPGDEERRDAGARRRDRQRRPGRGGAPSRGSRRLGVYRRERREWLPHVTVLRFRERPRLRPEAARPRRLRSVRGGCLPFGAAADRRAVRGSRRGSARRLMGLDREQALDVALGQIERQFGKGSVMRMSDQAAVSIGAVSTGSLSLDLALGIGGLPRGRIVEIFGPESSGKTTLVYHVIAEAQRRGGICASSTPSTRWTRPTRSGSASTSTSCSSPSPTPASRRSRSRGSSSARARSTSLRSTRSPR